MKVAIQDARMSFRSLGNQQPSKSDLIKHLLKRIKSMDEDVQFANASQSKLYALFDEAEEHATLDKDFKDAIEKKFYGF